VLQDGFFSRVGGKSTIKVDVRVLAATNKDLERAVAEHRFREDLYYRLNVIQLTVPPLRERVEEIPLLVDYFVRRYGRMFNREGFRPDPSALERLLRHRYPGNVRELENLVKRMIVLADPFLARTPLTASNGVTVPTAAPSAEPMKHPSLKEIARDAARTAERDAMLRALEEVNWSRVRAARLLRISYRALLYKMKDAGLQRHRAAMRASS
jgi:two-component system response regulator AtoC